MGEQGTGSHVRRQKAPVLIGSGICEKKKEEKKDGGEEAWVLWMCFGEWQR